MNNLLPAIMRTGVPIIYALLIRIGLGRLGLDDQAIVDVATVLLTALLYLALRGLEALSPKLGILLGWAKRPQYGTTITAAVTAATPAVEAATKADLAALRDDMVAAVASKLATPKPQSLTPAQVKHMTKAQIVAHFQSKES